MAKIVHLGKYYPPDFGGMESVTETLAEGACVQGFAVTVVCFDRGKIGDAVCRGVKVSRFPIAIMLNTQPFGWSYFWRGLCMARGADIVHLHTPNLLASLAVFFIGRKPKLLVHWHSDIVGKGWLGRLVRPLEYLMLRRANIILATSQRYADASPLLKKFSAKVSVVPLGVPDIGAASKHIPLSDRLENFLKGRRLILSVGRLTEYKGFSVLIDAAKSLPENTAIVIAGGGELMEKLNAHIEEVGAGYKILLAGRVTDEELCALYQTAEVFCLPSIFRAEAFGVVLLEAMSYGLPIVATDIEGSGVPWVNQHGVSGLNVEVKNSEELAKACTQIISDPALQMRLGQGARQRYEINFTNKIFTENFLEIYKKLL